MQVLHPGSSLRLTPKLPTAVSTAFSFQDVYPAHWDVVIAGVVRAGEEYEDTAARCDMARQGTHSRVAPSGCALSGLKDHAHSQRPVARPMHVVGTPHGASRTWVLAAVTRHNRTAARV